MTAADAWHEVAARRISITPALGLWVACVEVKGSGHNRKRALRSVSAVATSPIGAIRALIERIEGGEEVARW